jgi:hypothetical protein
MKLVLGYDPMSVKEGLKIALSGIGRGIISPTVRRRNFNRCECCERGG